MPHRAQQPSGPGPSQPGDASGSRARTRGGIGTPLTSLPSTARLRPDAPLLGDRRRTQPGPTETPAPQSAPPQAATPPASPSTPSGMPVRSAPAPVQRAVDGERPQGRTPTGTGTPGAPLASPATPPAPVRIRSIGPKRTGGGQATPTSSAPVSSAATGPLTPTVQRSRSLLSGRALKVNTGSAEGFSATPKTTATGGSTARPVVAATWRRDVQQPGPNSVASSSGGTPTRGGQTGGGQTGGGQTSGRQTGDSPTRERRTSPGAKLRRNAPRTRPAEPASAPSLASPHRTPAPGQAPAGPAPGSTVQRAVHGNPAPRRTTGDGSGPRVTAAPGTTGSGRRTPQGDAGRAAKAGAAPTKSGSAMGGAIQRLVQRRSVRNSAATPNPTTRTAGQTPQPQTPGTAPAGPYGPQPPATRPAPPALGTPSMPPMTSAAPTASPRPAPATRPVPVVRPHPPATARPGATVVPVQRMPLPVVPDPAGPPPAGPAPGGGAPPAGPPALSVRIPPRTHPSASGPSGPGAPAQPPTRAQALQRAAAQAGITGVPVKAVAPKGTPKAVQRADDDRSGFAPTSETAVENAANRISGAEIEELARRLLDPVSRLIRADMRRGRERAGRLHDGRR
ncbi:hypothetical protein ACK8N7_09660 [Streptomyces griseobrunneus]